MSKSLADGARACGSWFVSVGRRWSPPWLAGCHGGDVGRQGGPPGLGPTSAPAVPPVLLGPPPVLVGQAGVHERTVGREFRTDSLSHQRVLGAGPVPGDSRDDG